MAWYDQQKDYYSDPTKCFEQRMNATVNPDPERGMRLASDPTASLAKREEDILDLTARQRRRDEIARKPEELAKEREYRSANHWLEDTFGVDRHR